MREDSQSTQHAFSVYLDPDQARWLDSMEGLPDVDRATSSMSPWQRQPQQYPRRTCYDAAAPGISAVTARTSG